MVDEEEEKEDIEEEEKSDVAKAYEHATGGSQEEMNMITMFVNELTQFLNTLQQEMAQMKYQLWALTSMFFKEVDGKLVKKNISEILQSELNLSDAIIEEIQSRMELIKKGLDTSEFRKQIFKMIDLQLIDFLPSEVDNPSKGGD